MATILNTEFDLKEDYNFRTIAKLRHIKQHEMQPCLDDRFHRARVNYDLLGEILAKKQEIEFEKSGKVKKDSSKGYESVKFKKITFQDFILVIKNSIKEIVWKTIVRK